MKTKKILKRKKLGLLFDFMVLCFVFLTKQVDAEQWTVIKEKNGIVVEAQEVSDSPLKRVRGKAVIQASLGNILGLFNDSDYKLEWMPGVKERILEQISPGEMYIYQRISASMVSDRDVILHIESKFDEKEKAVYLTFESVASTPTPEKNQPEVSGVVRMPFVKGHWKLKPIIQGQFTEVEYLVHSNPGGRIPAWIANWVAKSMPYDTITTLRKQALIRKYPEIEKQVEQRPEYKMMIAP